MNAVMEQQLEQHGDLFVPPREPITPRIVTEKVVNARSTVLTQVTDHDMLQPLPAPATRLGEWQYAYTDGPVDVYDHVLDGNKVDIRPGVRPDALQTQLPMDSWQLNTY